MKTINAIIGFCLASTCFLSTARAQNNLTANFDNLTEGSEGTSFSDGGINFFNLTANIPNNVFTIQASTNVILGFSPPNYMTFVGYAPGNSLSFGEFGSMDMSFSGTGTFASLNIFGPTYDDQGNTLTLEALYNGTVVSSESGTLTGPIAPQQIGYLTLRVAGTFNSLELVVTGSNNDGVDYIGVDNVMVTVVPEPPASLLVSCGLIGLFLVRWQRRSCPLTPALSPDGGEGERIITAR